MTYMDNPNNFPGGHAGPNAQAAKPEPGEVCHCPCCQKGIDAPHKYHWERRPMPEPEPRQERQDGDSTGAMAAAWFGTPGTEGAISRVFAAQAAKPEPSKTPAQDYNDTLKAIFAAVGYTKEYALQWPREKASITFKRWFDEQLARAASPQQAPAQRLTEAQIPAVLFDGFAVLQALTPQAKRRTSGENVADTLDAVVRLMRAQIKEQP